MVELVVTANMNYVNNCANQIILHEVVYLLYSGSFNMFAMTILNRRIISSNLSVFQRYSKYYAYVVCTTYTQRYMYSYELCK